MNIKAQSSGLDFDYQFCLQIQNLSVLMSSISLSPLKKVMSGEFKKNNNNKLKPAAYFDLQNYKQRGNRRCAETCIALCLSPKTEEVKPQARRQRRPQQPAGCAQRVVEKHRQGRPDAVTQTGWARTGKRDNLKEELNAISAEV